MRKSMALLTLGVLALGLWSVLSAKDVFFVAEPRKITVEISSRKYAYNPPVIRVRRGDIITLKLRSEDVVHGLFLEGYDLDARITPERPDFEIRHPSRGEEFERVLEYTFVADKVGKFRYRCSHTCGFLHPFMLGEFVVSPNYLYWAGLGCVIVIAGGVLGWFALAGQAGSVGPWPRQRRGRGHEGVH